MRAAVLLAVLLAGPAAAGEEEGKPFPVDRSTILREEKAVYYVEGRQAIGSGVEISCQKDVYIRGRGDDPTLVVEGALKIHGVSAREVILENVTVELAGEFRDVHLDMAIFRDGGGVRTPAGAAVRGKLFVENVSFQAGAGLDVSFHTGSIDLSGVTTSGATRITAVDEDEQTQNRLRLNIRGSDLADLAVTNTYEVTVRLTRLAGGEATFVDCDSLDFDGNKVNASHLSIRHGVAGGLKKTRLTKCDVYSDRVSVRAPKEGGSSKDQVLADRCWFRGVTDADRLHEEVLEDAADDAENGARIRLGKLSDRPNELAGAQDR